MTDSEFKQDMQPCPYLKDFIKQTQVTLKRLNLFYFEAGMSNKQTLIMLHGLGDEADTWRHLFLPLSSQFHVIAPDLPGFGRSDKPKCVYTPAFFMETVLELMGKLEIGQANFVGSSLGAVLSHGIALKQPGCVASLALIGGGLVQVQPIKDLRLRLMQTPLLGEWMYTHLRKNPDAAFESLRSVYHNLDGLPKDDQDFLFKRVNKRVWSNGQRYAYFSTLRQLTSWLKAIQPELPRELSRLQIPTLIMRGEHDKLFSDENAEAIAKVQTMVTTVTVNDSGHLPHQERPERVITFLDNWLKPLLVELK